MARTVPSVISISYVLPVRLSVTDSVSLAVATDPAWPSPAWVSSLMHLSLRSAHGPPAGQRLRATSRGADRARTRVGAWAGGARAARPGRLAPAGRLLADGHGELPETDGPIVAVVHEAPWEDPRTVAHLHPEFVEAMRARLDAVRARAARIVVPSEAG